jgi:hypothetical protein
MVERRYSSIILLLSTRWRCVVSFTLLPLYFPGEKNLCYPLYRRLGGPKIRSGFYGKEKHLFPLSGIEPPILGFVLCSLVAILSEFDYIKYNTHKFFILIVVDTAVGQNNGTTDTVRISVLTWVYILFCLQQSSNPLQNDSYKSEQYLVEFYTIPLEKHL